LFFVINAIFNHIPFMYFSLGTVLIAFI
jgi:hypothetical protein